MKKRAKKLRHYYQVMPEKVQPVTYTDIWYENKNWVDAIPNDEKSIWYIDKQMTKSYRIECEKNGQKTKEKVVSQVFPVGFDIETNSIEKRSEETGLLEFCHGYMYHAQIIIGETIIHCRNWEQVENVFKVLTEKLNAGKSQNNEKKIIRVWDANLSFEFAFISRRFSWSRIFAAKPRKPITAETENGLYFQDALMISGTSLEKTAEIYDLPTRKTHDLDYMKTRISTTPLTEKELFYCSCAFVYLRNFTDIL